MHEEHPHPLLAQLPLTVSPFLSLPAATTLPYTYKSLPSTLLPSITDPSNNAMNQSTNPTTSDPSFQQEQKTPYVLSASGHAAHPDDIIASCHALQAHLNMLEQKARTTVAAWEERRRAAELAEKRRVAPGWLDEDVRMLVPERKGGGHVEAEAGGSGSRLGEVDMKDQEQVGSKEGEELDRAFGGLGIR